MSIELICYTKKIISYMLYNFFCRHHSVMNQFSNSNFFLDNFQNLKRLKTSKVPS